MKRTTKTTLKLTKADMKLAIEQYLDREGMIPMSTPKVTVKLVAVRTTGYWATNSVSATVSWQQVD